MVIRNQKIYKKGVIYLLNEIKSLNGNYIDNENVMELSPELKAIWDEMFICKNEIETILRKKNSVAGKGFWGFNADLPVTAYLLAKSFELSFEDRVVFGNITRVESDLDIISLAERNNIETVWMELVDLTAKHQQKIFFLVANLKELSNPMITPDSIRILAEELLEVNADDTVADLCCGTGIVASSIKKDMPQVVVKGFDVSADAIAVAKIYDCISDNKIEFEVKDIFELGLEENLENKYTKIFANYPFGLRLKDLQAGKEYLQLLEKRIPSMSKATSSDWLYNTLMIDLMAEKGKAIGVMTNGSTWNQIDAPIRKYFVENGLIECVVALPAKLFNSTTIATSMIIFSHNNEGVRLVNATELFTQGRRVNELEDSHLDAIIAATKEDSEISMFVELDELRDNDYVLSTSRYLNSTDNIQDGAEFESVIKRITRGAHLNAKDLDKIASPVPTDMQYLMLANVQNGLIDKDLPYITDIEKKNEKYCLTNRCLILSKNGYPYKIAVAEIGEGQKIMANGNLYIIELDEEKADPYYIAAYLGSEQGIAALKSITVGATIPNIGVEQLKRLVIPIPELEKQKEYAEKYKAAKDEITMLQIKLEKAKNKLAHIFEEGGNR